jgi:membrane protease YdiL (CAAX protease family)
LVAGVLKPVGLAAVAGLVALGLWAREVPSSSSSPWAALALGLMALAMALHAWPGFQRVPLFEPVRLSPLALPFGLFASVDKAIAGLVMLACVCRRCTTWADWRMSLRTVAWLLPVTAACVLGLGCLANAVRFEPKWPVQAALFLPANLLFTCVSEEAFFRGLLQERLMRALDGRPRWLAVAVPVVLSAMLFGAAHLGGGPALALFATLGGLGNAWAYARVRRIEAAIGVHFGLNALHFLLFTYPALA